MTDDAMPALPSAPLERAATVVMLAFAATLQISIAAADILLTVVVVLWIALLVRNHERMAVPPTFWPLAAYGGATLVSSVFAVDPWVSLIRSWLRTSRAIHSTTTTVNRMSAAAIEI